MGVIIKNPTTEKKIRRLAKRTGETLTQAVERAVDERLARLPARRKKGRIDRAKLAELLAYFDSLPVDRSTRSPDEIIGYNDNGVPRVIVVDTSALFAIASREDERDMFVDVLEALELRDCSTVTYVETIMVVDRRSSAGAESR